MDIAAWAQVVGALGALGAAVAAWRAVALSGRQQRQRDEPELVLDVVVVGNVVKLSVENIGGGVARKSSFRAVLRDLTVAGFLAEDGRLRPGDRVVIETVLPASGSDEIRAMALALDRFHAVHAWSRDGEHRRWSQRRWARRNVTDVWAFEQLYPGVDARATTPTPFQIVSPAVSRTA